MAVHDRIRLTGLLRRSPAHAGLLYALNPGGAVDPGAASSRMLVTGTCRPPQTIDTSAGNRLCHASMSGASREGWDVIRDVTDPDVMRDYA
jgi:hypothetical protein